MSTKELAKQATVFLRRNGLDSKARPIGSADTKQDDFERRLKLQAIRGKSRRRA